MLPQRLERLVRLLGLLQGGRPHNARSLADHCGVSKRTVYRDLNVLRDAGVPLVFDEENERYSIPGRYFLPPTNFTAEEALAVLVLCHELGGRTNLPFYEAAAAAAVKLENSLPRSLRDDLRRVSSAMQIRLGSVGKADGGLDTYQTLVRAIGDRRPVRIEYESVSDADMFKTKLSPYRLLFSRHSWYVIGRSTVHRAVRTFNLGRIRSIELFEGNYRIPRGFSLKRYLKNAWHLIPERGPDRQVHVRFRPLVARNVADVVWHSTQEVQWLSDGSLDFRVTVSGLWEISWWIMGYGDQAEVIEPGELRDMIRQRAERVCELYDQRGDG